SQSLGLRNATGSSFRVGTLADSRQAKTEMPTTMATSTASCTGCLLNLHRSTNGLATAAATAVRPISSTVALAQLGCQCVDPPADVVADLPHQLKGLPLRIWQSPVLNALQPHGRTRALVDGAAHRDDAVGLLGHRVGQQLGSLLGEIQPQLLH